MIEITQEMLDRIHTDSDVRDLADELGVSYKELDYAIENKYVEGSSCHNCKHICMGGMFPCNSCIRRYRPADYYESILESEEN